MDYSGTVAKSDKTVKNNIINTSISETELNSCAKVFQEMLNQASKGTDLKQETNGSNESKIDQDMEIDEWTVGGSNNKTSVIQDASIQNNVMANIVASMICSNEFTIQQKFLMARATQLTNDNVAAFLNDQTASSVAESSDGSNPSNLCTQKKKSWVDLFKLGSVDACVSIVNELIENNTENNVKNYLSKFSNEETSISQKNIDETFQNLENIINLSNLSEINQRLKIKKFEISKDAKNNNIEFTQKAKIINEIEQQINSEILSNTYSKSDSDTTNTKTETTDVSNTTTAENKQTATISTKISNLTVIIIAVVIAIIFIGAIIFLIVRNNKQKANASSIAIGDLLAYSQNNGLISLTDPNLITNYEEMVKNKFENEQITNTERDSALEVLADIRKEKSNIYFNDMSKKLQQAQFLKDNEWIITEDSLRVSKTKLKEKMTNMKQSATKAIKDKATGELSKYTKLL